MKAFAETSLGLVTAATEVILIVGGILLGVQLADEPVVATLVILVSLGAAGMVALTAWRCRRAVQMAEEAREQAQAHEHALRTTAAHLKGIWERAPVGLMVIEPETATIVDCNPECCRMHGYHHDELLGKSVDFLEAEPWAEGAAANWFSNLKKNRKLTGISRHRRKDGTVFEIEYTTSIIEVNGREFVIGMDHDVSDRLAAEAALRESEARWQLAVAGVNDGVWDWNLLTDEFWFSPRWKEMLGYAEDEIGTHIDEWKSRVHPDDLAKTMEATERHLCGETPFYQARYRMLHKNGRWIWIKARGKAVCDETGKPVRMIGTNSDITVEKKAEEALRTAKEVAVEADRAKSEFLAVMSHEIRTPLNGILGFTELLLNTELTDEQRDWIRTIHASGDTLLTLINDILDFSKIESGRMEIESRPVSVRQCVDEVFGILWSRAREKGLELRSKIAEDIPEWITSDDTRLRQVLINLVGNAIKFTETGHVTVEAEYQKDGDTEPVLIVSVIDTGVGIPKGRIDRLFKRFSQADSSTTRKYGGTGLGLAICRRLCELMGGDIEVAWTSSKGSCFRFHIAAPESAPPAREDGGHAARSPAVSERAPAGQAAPAGNDASLGREHPLRLLVAEDNRINQKLIARLLGRLGYEAAIVENGVECIEALKTGEYDLVLMDGQMPEMDGYEATRQIRAGAAGERNRDVRIVALTASAMAGDREACLEAGMNDYLSKPIRTDELAAVLRRAGRVAA